MFPMPNNSMKISTALYDFQWYMTLDNNILIDIYFRGYNYFGVNFKPTMTNVK